MPLKTIELVALIQAAYPQLNAQYHWRDLCILLNQYRELIRNQEHLQKLGWRSIKAGVEQTELVINRILIQTTLNSNYTIEQQGEYAAYISASNARNETIVAINPSEQQILLMPKQDIQSYGIWIMRLLESNLNFSLSVGNFDSQLPTVDYDLLEQYKLKRVAQMEALLKGPIEPLILITSA